MHPLRTLGRTGLKVTRLGLGLAALGRPGYINLSHSDDLPGTEVSAMEQHAHKVLDAAWEAGIRYFDAARSYGRAEEFLGSWLRARGIPPAAVTVGSKWGYTYTANWQIDADQHEVKEHSIEVLNRQWQESQANLDHHLDLYQIHSATLDSGVLTNHAVLARLAEIKLNGTAVGFSASGPNQAQIIEEALSISVDGARLFDEVQVTWNVLEPSTSAVLAQAHRDGVGIIVKEAVANGRLTTSNNDPDFAAQRAVLEQQAQRLDTTLDGLAIAAVLAQPWADVVLSGAARVDHLQSNIAALNVRWDEEAAQALAALAEKPDVYWSRRSDLAWN